MADDEKPESATGSLFGGRLSILQKEKGYRFSIDAIILAHHIPLQERDIAVDLGTGCGIIPLILAHLNPSSRLYGIEIQQDLADLAAKNVQLNGMEDRVTIIQADMKDFEAHLKPGMADIVFSNPPYRKILSGRLNPDPERAVAKHEVKARLSDVVSVAERLLGPSGRLVVIYPAERTADLITQMRACRLEPKRIRIVYSREDSDAELVLVEGSKQARPGVKILTPLIVHKSDGSYADEVKEMLARGNE